MVKENKQNLEELEEHILVLDEGMDVESMADPRAICCRGAIFPFRW